MPRSGFFQKEDPALCQGGCGIRCKLNRHCHSPKMPFAGEGKKGILLVGEAPGVNEDQAGVPFIGKSGQFLTEALQDLGVDINRDCWRTNAVRCHPVNNRTPTDIEIESCRGFVFQDVRETKPNVVILLGGTALECWLGHRWPEPLKGISRWRGFAVADTTQGCWVVPTFHPSYVLREQGMPAVERVFRLDLQTALEHTNKKLPRTIPDPNNVRILTPEAAVRRLQTAHGLEAMDFETTGLKPDAAWHKIVSMAVTNDGITADAFMVMDHEKVLRAVGQYMSNPRIRKIAANLKFEHVWAETITGATPREWAFDVCMSAHVLDNREGVTSVKFQAAVELGIFDYSSHVKSYMDAESKAQEKFGANAMNRILQMDRTKLLQYNGMDALVEWHIAHIHAKRLGIQL